MVASTTGQRRRISLLAALCLLLLVRLVDPVPLQTLRSWGFDLNQHIAPAPLLPAPVTIVDIDEPSLAAHGQWPWPRDKIARLIERANKAGARAIGLDILFPEADRTSPDLILEQWKRAPPPGLTREALASLRVETGHDATLAAALDGAPTVLALTLLPASRPGEPPRLLGNIPVLQSAAKGAGLVAFAPGSGGVYRVARLNWPVDSGESPAFALELLRVGAGAASVAIRRAGSGDLDFHVADRVVAADPEGRVWLRALDPGSFRWRSAGDILRPGAAPHDLQDRLVIIGSSAAGLFPSYRLADGSMVSDVALQAQIVGNLLSGAYLRRTAMLPALEIALALFACLTLARSERSPRGALLAIAAGACLLGLPVLAHLAFQGGWLVDWTFPWLAAALAATLLFAVRVVEAQRLRKEARHEHDVALSLVGLAQRARSSFLANLSHELRTPLNIVIGGAEVIARQSLGAISPERYRDYGAAILNGGHALLSIVNRTQALVSTENAQVRLADDIVSLREAVLTAVARCFPAEDGSAWRVAVVEPERWPSLAADERMVGAMLDCLLSNARKFASIDPRVEINCELTLQHDVRLSIADHGQGMTPRQINAALAPFQRLDFHFANANEGVGFGLPLTRAMIQLHGGRLDIEPRSGGGSIVSLVFPGWRLRDPGAISG